MSGPRAPQSLRHESQSTPLKFEEPVWFSHLFTCPRIASVPPTIANLFRSTGWKLLLPSSTSTPRATTWPLDTTRTRRKRAHTSDEHVEVGIGVAVGYHHDVELPRIRDHPYGEGHSRDQPRHREHLQQSRPGEIEQRLRAGDVGAVRRVAWPRASGKPARRFLGAAPCRGKAGS